MEMRSGIGAVRKTRAVELGFGPGVGGLVLQGTPGEGGCEVSSMDGEEERAGKGGGLNHGNKKEMDEGVRNNIRIRIETEPEQATIRTRWRQPKKGKGKITIRVPKVEFEFPKAKIRTQARGQQFSRGYNSDTVVLIVLMVQSILYGYYKVRPNPTVRSQKWAGMCRKARRTALAVHNAAA